jgi:predicted lipoprotein
MKNLIAAFAIACLPGGAHAQSVTADIVENHILPGFATLAETSQALSQSAAVDCTATSAPLRAAYGNAFDAWVAVNHLRFGPTEVADRGFALAFWPDSRGATPKALATLIRDADPIAESAAAYGDMSIAARGFYAMEFLLYDQTLSTEGEAGYRCQLVQTVAADIANLTDAINTDWQTRYAALLTAPSDDGLYRNDTEAAQELFKALTTGLQLTADTRLGRPLGTFTQPRPKRAEAWRSGRSAHHVAVALTSLQDLAERLSRNDAALQDALDHAFSHAQTQLRALNDPIFAGVAAPQTRIKVEVLQQSVQTIHTLASTDLGPSLGVAAGFNALDGD